jgi:hypothetical protein
VTAYADAGVRRLVVAPPPKPDGVAIAIDNALAAIGGL